MQLSTLIQRLQAIQDQHGVVEILLGGNFQPIGGAQFFQVDEEDLHLIQWNMQEGTQYVQIS